MKLLRNKANLFITVMLIGTATYFISPVFSREYAYTNFLYIYKTDTFMDFFNTNMHVSKLDPYSTGSYGIYPPLAYLMIYPLSTFYNYEKMSPSDARTDQNAILSFVLFLITMFVILGSIFFEILKEIPIYKRTIIVLLLILSAPSIFLIERGNYLIVAVVALFIFVLNYKSTNTLFRELSLISLAISISFKISPAIFILLLFEEKRWKDIAKLSFYLLIMFIIPSLFFKGGLIQTVQSILHNFLGFVQFNEGNDIRATAYQINIPAFSRIVTIALNDGISIPLYKVLAIFVSLVYLVFGIWAFSLTKVFWKKLSILVSLMVLIPSSSGLYYVTFYFIPLVYYLDDKQVSKFDFVYTILFAMLFFPKQYFLISKGNYVVYSNTFFTIIVALYLLTILLVDCLKQDSQQKLPGSSFSY
jgi:hypothetical protein